MDMHGAATVLGLLHSACPPLSASLGYAPLGGPALNVDLHRIVVLWNQQGRWQSTDHSTQL